MRRRREARRGRRTLVFVDEVHRFNKGQQDAFLPHVESGLFTFIGATTENPSFEVNSALLSRATVHVLKSLGDDELGLMLDRAQRDLQAPPLTAAARTRLVAHADGDGRRLLNAYESLVELAGPVAEIDEPALERTLGELLRRYDKGGDQFYDSISALHKSCAASTPTPRCTGWRACSTGGPTRATWRAACCAWPARTSGWPTRAPCAWRSTPARSSNAWARPKANWPSPKRWSTWPSRPSRMRSTWRGTRCVPR
jgi:hypothetical protein